MSNLEAARQLVARVVAAGARDFCVCAGSRNSPLLAVLGQSSGLSLFSFVDERSAAFFALGRVKQHGRPAVVVTTSGTAAAELLAAAIEASYSGLPLILITADRPARFRGTGAPQAIEQEGLFGPHAASGFEAWRGQGPLHLNIAFDEPLIDGELRSYAAAAVDAPPLQAGQSRMTAEAVIDGAKRPLVLIGGLSSRFQSPVRNFALGLGAPVYAEPLSGLREDVELAALLIRSEHTLSHGGFDRVIRIGNVPTVRFWRDLDESLRELPVVSFGELPFAGLSRGEIHPIDALPSEIARIDPDENILAHDREMAARIDAIIDGEPESEPGRFRRLSIEIPMGARVYLGNSLPIREWDLAATRQHRGFEIEANRGANGIDGQLSTFFGWCRPDAENVAVIGDLTAVYDLNAPWIVPQLDPSVRFRIYVINNGGGRIFSRVPSLRRLPDVVREQLIENRHSLSFQPWAAMWSLAYGDSAAARGVIEVRPDAAATARVWARHDELWR